MRSCNYTSGLLFSVVITPTAARWNANSCYGRPLRETWKQRRWYKAVEQRLKKQRMVYTGLLTPGLCRPSILLLRYFAKVFKRYRKFTVSQKNTSQSLTSSTVTATVITLQRLNTVLWRKCIKIYSYFIICVLFCSKLGFSRILDLLYGTFWPCSRVRL